MHNLSKRIQEDDLAVHSEIYRLYGDLETGKLFFDKFKKEEATVTAFFPAIVVKLPYFPSDSQLAELVSERIKGYDANAYLIGQTFAHGDVVGNNNVKPTLDLYQCSLNFLTVVPQDKKEYVQPELFSSRDYLRKITLRKVEEQL